MEMLMNPELAVGIKMLFGEALSSEFVRMSAVFTFAAFVHGRQVRNEIRAQLGELSSVLRADLTAQKEAAGLLQNRVSKIETHLNMEDKYVRHQ